jgi:MFS family permease
VLLSAVGSYVGDNIAPIALAFAVIELRGSAADLAVVLGGMTAATVVGLLIGGVYGDRVSRSQLIAAANVVNAAAQIATGALLLLADVALAPLVGLQVVHGLANGVALPSSRAIAADVIEGPKLQQANGLLSMCFSLGGILGPLIGGFLVVGPGPGWAVVCDGVTFLWSAAIIRGVRSRRPPAEVRRPFRRDLRDGWAEVRSRSWLVAAVASSTLLQFSLYAAITVLGPLVAERSLGGASAWAAAIAGFSAGGLAGALVATSLTPRRPLRAVYLLNGCVIFTPLLLAIPGPAWAIVLTESLSGFALAVAVTLFMTVLQNRIPPGSLARVISLEWMAATVARPTGLLLIGPLVAATGVETTLLGAAALIGLAAAGPLSLASVRTLPAGCGYDAVAGARPAS